MNSFHELSLKEQATVTREQLDAYEAYEMMSEGVPVLSLAPPATEPVAPVVKKTQYYAVKFGRYDSEEVAFRTLEAANTFAALGPLKIEHEYTLDAKYIGVQDQPAIVTVDYMSESDYAQAKSALAAYATEKKRYDAEKSAYDKWYSTKSKVLEGLHNTWYSARQHATSMERIRETFTAYIKTAGGDRDIAMKFLMKAYTPEQITEATEWFDGVLEYKEAE